MDLTTYDKLEDFRKEFERDYYVYYYQHFPNFKEYISALKEEYLKLWNQKRENIATILKYVEVQEKDSITYEEQELNNKLINFSRELCNAYRDISYELEEIELKNEIKERDNGYSTVKKDYVKEERKPKDKIVINGNIQLLGYIIKNLIDGGYIEPIKFGNDTINNSATSKMFLEHFEFTENNKQPSAEYLKKAIFENSFSMKKAEDFLIPHINYFNSDK